MPSYTVPAGEARAEIREKGSVFLAVAAPVGNEAAAKDLLGRLAHQYPDATHHCWAWRLGSPPIERSADAGEPSGTAGVPILQVLRGADLSDILCVVVRWFGGTKLGKGGLARAYAAAARAAVDTVARRAVFAVDHLVLTLAYDQVGAAKRVLHPPEIELESEEYGEQVHLRLRVRRERCATVEARLADLGIGASQVASQRTAT